MASCVLQRPSARSGAGVHEPAYHRAAVTRSDDKRRKWFSIGAEAVSKLTGRSTEGYWCPLCWDLFPVEALDPPRRLSIEHVPPKAVGGRELVLTCDDCNNGSGRELDSHAANEHRVLGFKLKEDTKDPAGEKIKVDGFEGRLTIADGVITTRLVDANPPGARTDLSRAIEEGRQDDLSVTLTFRPFEESLAGLSYVRAALLVVFASWGYSAIASAAYDKIREQIANPDPEVLSPLVSYDGSAPLASRRLAVVTSPRDLACLHVTFGPRSVTLPLPDDHEFFARLGERMAQARSATFRGAELPWPTRPSHLLDLQESDPDVQR